MSAFADATVRSRRSHNQCSIHRLSGLTAYVPMWDRQQELAAERALERIGDQLIFLEHDHVYTNGWRGDRSNLLADDRMLATLGATYVETDRGGDITYHGPGQLVGYPIIDLRERGLGVRNYIHGLQRIIIETLSCFGIAARSHRGLVGVWVGNEKIAAIGVRVKRGITYHGFALNVDPDLSYFDHIVPCGIHDRGVTSVARLLGCPVPPDEMIPTCCQAFAQAFNTVATYSRSRDALAMEIPG